MRGAGAGMLVLSSALLGAAAHAQTGMLVTLGEVLIVYTPPVKPDADRAAFEREASARLAAAAQKTSPALRPHLFRADRGGRKGQYAFVWTSDRKSAGASPSVAGDGTHSEYHLIAPETAGTPPEIDVLGIHYIKVRSDRAAEFERFVRDRIHPAVASLRPDLRVLYYKSVRGADAGSYITIFALTQASRDRYWPGGSDSDDLRAAFAPVQTLTPELKAFFVEGSYLDDPKFAAAVYESREWADFVLVPPPSAR